MTVFRDSVWLLGGTAAVLLAVGCGGRPSAWDSDFDLGQQASGQGNLKEPQLEGLTGALSVLDPNRNELLMLTSPRRFELAVERFPVGRDVVKFDRSRAQDKLFVLSRGVVPRLRDSDEAPQLRVFDGSANPRELEKFTLQDPYDQLEIDPEGQWLIVHGSEGLVSNPNELILVELDRGRETLPSQTLDSYGGKPRKFRFSPELNVPGTQPRRLLVVLREKDLAIIDLTNLDAPEITVGMPEKAGGGFATPADVAFHDGVAGETEPMLAVRLEGDPSVYLLTLRGDAGDPRGFSLDANLVDVGGAPSAVEFVHTERDGGLRVAALVPTRSAAVLVDPTTSTTQDVALPRRFTSLARTTNEAGEDVALLYGDAKTIAFWQLGAAVGTPYRSIDSYDIGIQVSEVSNTDSADRKVLSGTSGSSVRQFYVLDLTERKSFPLDALRDLTLNVAPDGGRLWAYEPFTSGFAQLTFDPLQPTSLYTEAPILYVHELRTAAGGSERSAVALHVLAGEGGSTLAATLFDGVAPSSAKTKFIGSIELMGIK